MYTRSGFFAALEGGNRLGIEKVEVSKRFLESDLRGRGLGSGTGMAKAPVSSSGPVWSSDSCAFFSFGAVRFLFLELDARDRCRLRDLLGATGSSLTTNLSPSPKLAGM